MHTAMDLLKSEYIGIRDFREHFSATLKKPRSIVITDHGSPQYVLVKYAEMLELLDMVEEASSPETVKLVADGRKSIQSGAKGIPVSRLLKKIRQT